MINSLIVAVIVTYNPEKNKLEALIKSLINQVAHILVVDNGSASAAVAEIQRKFSCNSRVHWLFLNQNKGVASAHNVGIAKARDLRADYLILFDHDSLPAQNMIHTLLSVAQDQELQGYKVAAVGPNYFDDRQNNPPPFVEIKGFQLHRKQCNTSAGVVTADYLISSGCLIPMKTLDIVGGMREELFIDFIDIEWGLRAKKMGYQSFGACAAYMKHDLGDSPAVFCGKAYPSRSPFRHYYHFRNAIWMYKQAWVPWNWKVVDGWKLLLKFGFYSMITKPRAEHFKMMVLGAWHGITGRMGPLS